MVLLNILIAFTRANLLGYGGGPSVIPLVENEVVYTYHWMTSEEFANVLAVGNALPGPIATKMGAYIGFKVAGYPGAIVALLGTFLPSAILMVALSAILLKYKNAPVIKGMIAGAKPVVWVLFVLLVLDFFPFVRPDKVGWIPPVIALLAFVAAYFFKVNQAIVIFAGIVAGGLFIR